MHTETFFLPTHKFLLLVFSPRQVDYNICFKWANSLQDIFPLTALQILLEFPFFHFTGKLFLPVTSLPHVWEKGEIGKILRWTEVMRLSKSILNVGERLIFFDVPVSNEGLDILPFLPGNLKSQSCGRCSLSEMRGYCNCPG